MTRVSFLGAMIASSILLPWIPIASGLPELRPEWFIMLAGLALLPVMGRVVNSRVGALTSLVLVTYVLSIVYGAVVMEIPIDPRDITILMQPILYFLIYVFVASGSYSQSEYRTILGVALMVLGVAALIAVIQFFNPDLIAPLLRLWADEERIGLYVLSRATGTMGNANDLGFLMNIGFALTLFTLRHRILPIVFSRLILLVTFLGVFASGSRTAMICLLTILMVFFVLEMRKSIKTVLLTAIALGAIVQLFRDHLAELELAAGLVSRVMSFGSLEEDTAWLPRVYGAIETLHVIAESWLFGHGPAKAVFTVGSNIDNEFILLLYRHGIFGTLATAGLVWVLARQQSKSSVRESSLLASMKNFIWASLLAGALFAYTAGLFMSFRLFGLLVVLWTVSACVRVKPRSSIAREDALCNGINIGNSGHAHVGANQ